MIVKTIVKPRASYIPTSASVALFPAGAKSCALLSQFQPQENAGDERALALKMDSKTQRRLDRLERAYSAIGQVSTFMPKEEYYDCIGRHIRRLRAFRYLRYSPDDVTLFSQIVLPKFSGSSGFKVSASIFLNVLINCSKDNDFKVVTDAFPDKLTFFGYLNSKNITVVGGLGRDAGYGMAGGKLTIIGNAGDSLGDCMEGGEIQVDGNCGIIEKTMLGGAIHVNGNIQALKDKCHPGLSGDVYQRGRLLVKDGEIVAQPINM